jgi:hypothetical protein
MLPEDKELRKAILKKFGTWASFRDGNWQLIQWVLRSSLAIFDCLVSERLLPLADFEEVAERDLLTVAALSHETAQEDGHSRPKRVVRLFERLTPPPGWTKNHLLVAGLAARYHAGAPPSVAHARFAALSETAQVVVTKLAGVLRLADALDTQQDGMPGAISVAREGNVIYIFADGFARYSKAAERIAAARNMLETACGMPVLVRPAEQTPIPAARLASASGQA